MYNTLICHKLMAKNESVWGEEAD